MSEVFTSAALVTQNAMGNTLISEGTQASLSSQSFFIFNGLHPFLGIDFWD